MSFSANGKPLLTAVLSEPGSRAWIIDVEVESGEDLTPNVTVELGNRSATLVGTVVRGGVYQGRYAAQLVGGAGGLGRELPARYYDAVPVRTVLAGIMADAGEELDGTVAASILGRSLSRWIRPRGTAAEALDDLAKELGVVWRVTRAGKIWLGAETWPKLEMSNVEMARGRAGGTLSLAPSEAPLVRPGVTFQGERVSYVVTTLSGGKLRQELWLDEGRGDRVASAFERLFERFIGRKAKYLGHYPATVVRQSADGLSLEVVPDDEEIRGEGLKRVPIRHGSPGWGVRVPKGTRIEVAFDGGDPSRPRVANWFPGAADEVTFNGGTRGVAGLGDMVQSWGPSVQVMFVGAGAPPNSAVVVGVPYAATFLVNGVPSPYLPGSISSATPALKVP